MPGTLTVSTLSDGTNSTSATNAIRGSSKAWANFYGFTSLSINGSLNVSSITRNGTGLYTFNFTSALTAGYALSGVSEGSATPVILGLYASGGIGTVPAVKTTSQCQVLCGSGGGYDCYSGSVIFFSS